MVRKLRQNSDIEGGIYHIVCRGVNQRRIFRSSRDYNKFLSFLIETKKKFPFYLYSYNLLPNHVHLEIERRKVSLSKFMHYFNTCYSIYFNRRYKRSGHFFQDRFHSSLIDTESYFWQVSSYIDLIFNFPLKTRINKGFAGGNFWGLTLNEKRKKIK